MKRTISFALFLYLLFCGVAASFSQSPGSREYYVKYGREYFEAGSFASAANYFEQGVSRFPDDAKMHFFLRQTYLRLKKSAEAGRELQ